jgi:hypothetical protein
MSGLVFQNTKPKCNGWTNPADLNIGPHIDTLSSFYSPAASNSLVVVFGTNFYSYSSIQFSTFTPTVYFINSNQLEFYVPTTSLSGIYAIQVFNGSFGSNIVNYTLDNASGYWIRNSNGTITNTNTNNNPGIQGGLLVNGNVTIDGMCVATSFNPTSDYRIKSVLEHLSSTYSIDNLKPVKYLNTKTNTVELGFLAHEVQQEFPYLVSGEKDGECLQTINYNGLIAVLVKEIQQLKSDVTKLQQLII